MSTRNAEKKERARQREVKRLLVKLALVTVLALTASLWFPLVLQAAAWTGSTYWEHTGRKILVDHQARTGQKAPAASAAR